MGWDKWDQLRDDELTEAYQRGLAKGREELAIVGKKYVEICEIIHYPHCWDTAAYPTVNDALKELFKFCSTCND